MPPVPKEQMKKLSAEIDVGMEELHRRDIVFHLGELAAAALMTVGSVTLVRNPSGKVAIANPIHVYLAPHSIMEETDTELPPFKWVRPVISSGRPQYAAFRQGELWEIEFEDESSSDI